MGGFVSDFVKVASGGAVDLDKANEEAAKALAKANEEATKAAKAAGEAARAAAEHGKAAAEAALATQKTLALLPLVIAKAAATNKPNDIRDAVAELVRVSSDGVSAASLAASQPYFLAADITKNDGGDGAKLLRGAIEGKLVEINIIPALLKQIGHLDAQTPEEIGAAIATAPLSAVLAAYLVSAHDALEPYAKPMPLLVRNALRPFFTSEVLAKVKYIASPLGLTLPEVINGYQVFMGNHAHAVTVGNVIAFSIEPGTSDDDVFWWAHETCHVEQYERLSFDGFAKAYVENYKNIESEAESRAEKVKAALAGE
ncbi:DUF4157 domain-containing protein [Undibacterium sp.]|uniref:eCIS core domain-containing protein n=1 Tax=Undibacterium sp. TaxID=1914977 RepID=UPI00272F49C9|nr:DUF4157 domain-containing protein [Undibacterium sp.]MDP1977616.1 DUF4157 domain-containing protein [Undibacterium sp.]